MHTYLLLALTNVKYVLEMKALVRIGDVEAVIFDHKKWGEGELLFFPLCEEYSHFKAFGFCEYQVCLDVQGEYCRIL